LIKNVKDIGHFANPAPAADDQSLNCEFKFTPTTTKTKYPGSGGVVVYLETISPVKEGKELLTWYGDDYRL
jgi:hypothetical protein